jgi:acyl-CoA thioester hydrolase
MQNLLRDFPITTKIKVEWRNMDSGRHVHNMIYVGWTESSRVDYFESMNFSIVPVSGTGVIVGYLDCKYIVPITYPDMVIAATRAINYGKDHVWIETYLFSKKLNCVAAISKQKMVFYDFINRTKMEMPEDFLAKMEALEEREIPEIE